MNSEIPRDLDWLTRLQKIEPSKQDEKTDHFLEVKTRQEAAKADEIELRNEKRYRYANIFTGIAIGWLVFVGLIILFTGLAKFPLSLSDTVLVTLLGTATVNVLSPAVLLAKYLFNNQP